MERMDPWAVLGVAQNASLDEVKSAYRRVSKRNHPDLGGSHADFLAVRRAFETIAADRGISKSERPISNQVVAANAKTRSLFSNTHSSTSFWDVGAHVSIKESFEEVLARAVVDLRLSA